eukprot:4537362-Amphidinium_carterae.1
MHAFTGPLVACLLTLACSRKGHLNKIPDCPGWQLESGPRIIHSKTPKSDRQPGVLHGDLAKIGTDNRQFTWILVLAATVRVKNENCILPFYFPLLRKDYSGPVARKVAETIIWLRSSPPYCSPVEDGRHIKRFMSDKGGEFESDVFIKMLREQGVMQTNRPSYQPQSNGLAERMVGLMKTSCARLLLSANMANSLWPYAVQLSAQQQQASVLGCEWSLPRPLPGNQNLRSKVFTSPFWSLVLPDGQDVWLRVDDGFIQSDAPSKCIPLDVDPPADIQAGNWEEKVN